MNTKRVIIIVAGCLLCLMIFIYLVMKFSFQNNEVRLRNQGEAQQQVIKVVYDNTWKTVSQIAQVAVRYESTFKEIFPKLMDARYQREGENLLAKFITEQNPNLSTELYSQINDAIRANRAEFTRAQARLLDIKREHDNARLTFPSSWWCGKRPELVLQIVTSTKTEETFKTGKEDNVDLFSK